MKGYSFILPGLDLHPVTSSCQSHFVPECLESAGAGGRKEFFSEKKRKKNGLCSFNMTGSLNPGTSLTRSRACVRMWLLKLEFCSPALASTKLWCFPGPRGEGETGGQVSAGSRHHAEMSSIQACLCRRGGAGGEMNSKLWLVCVCGVGGGSAAERRKWARAAEGGRENRVT